MEYLWNPPPIWSKIPPFAIFLKVFSANSLNFGKLAILEYLNKNEIFAAFGNFGAEPKPPYVGSPNWNKFIAASSSKVRSNFVGTVFFSVLCNAWIKLSADFSTSFGFSFHACANCLHILPKPGLP